MYLNRFVTAKCAPDLLAMKMFPNAKEVTETYGMVEASAKIGEGFEWNNPNVCLIAVGDGHKPRTAATFAMRTAWDCHSVDPVISNVLFPVKRLTIHRKKIEDCQFNSNVPVLVVACHSHAKLDDAMRVIKAPRIAVISMPCCVTQRIGDIEPDEIYEDDAIWSPHNKIKIWRDVRVGRAEVVGAE